MKNLSLRIGYCLRFLSSAFLIALTSSSIFAAPGDLDTSFGSNGFVFNDLGYPQNGGPSVEDIAIQPDGKILIAGRRTPTVGKPVSRSYVARLNADGTFDSSFAGGVVLEDLGIFSTIYSIVVQPDGKIVVGGTVLRFSGGSTPPVPVFFVIRYNANGTRDTSFLNGGTAFTAFSRAASLVSVLLQPDGKIVAAGNREGNQTSGASFAVTRYNADGTSDLTFGVDAKVETTFTNFAAQARQAVLQTDGKIVIAGDVKEDIASGGVKSSFALARYNSNGSLDTAFGSGGRVVNSFSEDAGLTTIALQTDGKIVGAGYRILNADYKFAVARYDSSGAFDSTFGTNGIVTTDFSAINTSTIFDVAQEVLIQRNGKIITVGDSGASDSNIALARYNQNGSLDTTFGQGGKVLSNVPQLRNRVLTAVLQTDGKIIAGGNASDNSSGKISLARYFGDAPTRPPFDFDGDGRTDISVFRGGTWHLQRSQLGFTAANWGIGSDLVAPADFDGDGKTDLTVYRPSNGEWSVFNSLTHSVYIVRFGAPEDLPRPADYDGDGKADICVFRPSNGTWYRLNSSNGQFVATAFGQSGDAPLIADFDGDGKSDIAVFRPSNGTWYWLRSSDGQFGAVAFGANGDKPVAADYDGDGKTDVAVFRPSNGTWYRLNSSNGSFFAVAFGQAGDVPTLGDYDGDGKSEIAVFRPAGGVWYRLNSGSGNFYYELFGVNGDRPIPAAFVP